MPRASPPGKTKTSGAGFGGFAEFLRRYLSAWPVVIACLIGPVTKYLNLLPLYADHKNILASVTSLYGFLAAAALFYYRPVVVAPAAASRASGRRAWLRLLPAALAVVSVGGFFRYTFLVESSVRAERQLIHELVDTRQLSTEQVLARTDFADIPDGMALIAWYLLAFLAAETSLVVMALAEYAQSDARRKRVPQESS